MIKRPVPQKEVAISFILESYRLILFYASLDAASDMQEFGDVRPGNRKSFYQLVVDARYEFSDVVAYIENYG